MRAGTCRRGGGRAREAHPGGCGGAVRGAHAQHPAQDRHAPRGPRDRRSRARITDKSDGATAGGGRLACLAGEDVRGARRGGAVRHRRALLARFRSRPQRPCGGDRLPLSGRGTRCGQRLRQRAFSHRLSAGAHGSDGAARHPASVRRNPGAGSLAGSHHRREARDIARSPPGHSADASLGRFGGAGRAAAPIPGGLRSCGGRQRRSDGLRVDGAHVSERASPASGCGRAACRRRGAARATYSRDHGHRRGWRKLRVAALPERCSAHREPLRASGAERLLRRPHHPSGGPELRRAGREPGRQRVHGRWPLPPRRSGASLTPARGSRYLHTRPRHRRRTILHRPRGPPATRPRLHRVRAGRERHGDRGRDSRGRCHGESGDRHAA